MTSTILVSILLSALLVVLAAMIRFNAKTVFIPEKPTIEDFKKWLKDGKKIKVRVLNKSSLAYFGHVDRDIGRVVSILEHHPFEPIEPMVGIEMDDESFKGHALGGLLKSTRGYFSFPRRVEIVSVENK